MFSQDRGGKSRIDAVQGSYDARVVLSVVNVAVPYFER